MPSLIWHSTNGKRATAGHGLKPARRAWLSAGLLLVATGALALASRGVPNDSLLARTGVQDRAKAIHVQEPEPAKEPVPDVASQAKAEQLIKDLFKGEYAKRRRSDLQEFAAKLFQEGVGTKEDPVARFVLLREARDLAVQGADPATAMRAIDELARWYAVDGLDMKASALEKLGGGTSTAAAAKTLVDYALAAVHDAVDADAFDAATRLLKFAEAMARKTKSVPLVTSVLSCRKDLEQVRKENEAVQPAVKVLEKNPADPDASLAMGKYLCLLKGNWDQGLPYLAQSNDAKLSEAANKDLNDPKEAQEQADVGDAWWELAMAERGPSKTQLQLRAFHWYRQARPKLTGVAKTKIDKIMKLMPIVYLADLQEVEARMGPWKLGKGTTGDPAGTRIVVNGVSSPNGLGMHPPGRGSASVSYRLGRSAQFLTGAVGFNDASGGARSPILFQVQGDGRLLWSSPPMQAPKKTQDFAISLAGVDILELRVVCADDTSGAHAVWIEPHVVKTSLLVRTRSKP